MAEGPLARVPSLPSGVVVSELSAVDDERGLVAELHRRSADAGGAGPAQWNVMASSANTLRGMHAHVRHTDWITAVAGEARLGLVDLRTRGAEDRRQMTLTLSTQPMQMVMIPPGVLHGIYTSEFSVVLNGLSHEYDPEDDFAVRFDDPQIDLDWIVDDPVLSERDRSATSIAGILETLAERGLRFPALEP